MDPLATLQLQNAAVAAPTEQNAAWAVALFHIFQNLTDLVTGKMDGGINAMIGAEVAWLNPVLKAAITAAIIVWGVGAAYGHAPVSKVMPMLIRAAVVMTIVGSAANYENWVQNVLNNAPTEIGNMLSGPIGGNFQGAGAFDNALNATLKAAAICYENTPLSFKAIFVYLALVICVAIVAYAIVMSFVVWFISLLALKMLLAIGPICIAFAVWGGGPTSQWAANWLGVTASTIGAQVLVIMVLVLIGFGEQQTVNNVQQGAGNNPMTELQAVFVMAMMSGVMSLFVGYIPSIAERIFNGLAFRAEPYISAAAGVGRGAAAAAGKAKDAVQGAGAAVNSALGTTSRTFVSRPAGP